MPKKRPSRTPSEGFRNPQILARRRKRQFFSPGAVIVEDSGLAANTETRKLEMKRRKNAIAKKFLWTPAFWGLIGLVGCGAGLYFQSLAGNGMGLWFLGMIFLGAAYVERQDAR
jgi:hypothetical protein